MNQRALALLLACSLSPLASPAAISIADLELYYSFDAGLVSTYVTDEWTAEGGLSGGEDVVWNTIALSTFSSGAKFGDALDVSTFSVRPHQNTIDAVNSGFLPGTGDYSLTFWYRQSAPATQTSVFGAGAMGDDVYHSQGLQIYVTASGELLVAYQDEADTTGVRSFFTASGATFNGSTWNHIALIRRGTELSLWINGNAAGSATLPATCNLAVPPTEWTREVYLGDYGPWPYVPADVANSAFDDMAIFKRALNPSEIAQIWSNGSGATIRSLMPTCPTITVTPATLSAGVQGSPYNQMLAGQGGLAPYQFALASGSLPSGLALSTDGTISGTPSASAYTRNFEIVATDANGCAGTSSFSLTISGDSFATGLELYYSFDTDFIGGPTKTYVIDQWTNEFGLYNGVDTVWNVNSLAMITSGAKFNQAVDTSGPATRPHQDTPIDAVLPFLPGAEDYTVTFWYRQSAPVVQTSIFGAGAMADDVNHSQGMQIYVTGNGELLVNYQEAGDLSGVRNSFSAPGAIFDGVTWNHIALVRNGTDFRLWINGQSAGNTTLSPGFNIAVSPNEWTREVYLGDYGPWPYSPAVVANSAFDDMAVFRRALSNSELAQVWNGGTGRTISALISPATAIPIDYSVQEGKLVLNWADSSFKLYSAANPAGPFVLVDGATSPYTNSLLGEKEFFRLKKH